MNESRIVLVRHGRSLHVESRWLDYEGFARWREIYELAGIAPDDLPPAALRAIATSRAIVIASDAPRAIESARAITGDGRKVVSSPLLRELELTPPPVRGIRMPMPAWALLYGVRWLARIVLRRAHESNEERTRADDAARWLASLAVQHGTVIAVTHASFRSLLSRRLAAEGWVASVPRRRLAHWSAWSFRPAPPATVPER